MKPLATLLAASALLCGPVPAGVTFGPPRLDPGQSVRLLVRSEVSKGTVESSSPEGRSNGTMKILRERDILWTIQQPAADGSPRLTLRVPRFETTSTIDLGDRPDTRHDRSPLVGMQLAATRDNTGKWSFTGNGRPLGDRAHRELEELAAYQARDWFPDGEVQTGDSWEFDPRWLRLVILRDLRDAQMVGTMKLRQVRRTRAAQNAVIDIEIRSSGAKLDSTGRSTGATIALRGQARINLETMLDESIELSGTIRLQSHHGAKRTTFHLPIRMTATKTIEQAGEHPEPAPPTPPRNSREPN